jgi:hypothetical protein
VGTGIDDKSLDSFSSIDEAMRITPKIIGKNLMDWKFILIACYWIGRICHEKS